MASKYVTVADVDGDPNYNPPLTARYLRRLVFEKRIPVHRLGGKVFFARADIDAYLANTREEAAS